MTTEGVRVSWTSTDVRKYWVETGTAFNVKTTTTTTTTTTCCFAFWPGYVGMYVCMVITYSRVWINRVRLPILLVVSWTGKMKIPLSPCVPENLVSRDGFSRPVPRQPAHLHTQAESGAYLRDCSRVPRRRPYETAIRHRVSPEFIGSRNCVYPVVSFTLNFSVRKNPSSCDYAEIRTHFPTATNWTPAATGNMMAFFDTPCKLDI